MSHANTHRRGVARLLPVALALFLPSCTLLRPARVPIPVVTKPTPTDVEHRTLLVLLPGIGDRPEDLLRRGMVEMVHARGIAADVVVADAHYGYYRQRQTVQRLWEDIVLPARTQGYRSIWLAGISLGGFGTLLYGAKAPPEALAAIDGLIAIAPYLGDEDVAEEIRDAGGLAVWPCDAANGEYTRQLFAWLRGYADPEAPRPPLFLGVGADDRYADQARLVAPLLPAGNYLEVQGAHEWRPWLRIWGEMLDRAPLPRTAGAVAAQR